MKLKVIIYTLLQVYTFLFVTGVKFEDITSEVFPVGEDIGIIAAFGHFNSDEYTDIVSLQLAGKKLQILEGSENRPYFQISLNCSFKSEILGVVPGDYNGDSLVDILIVFRSKESKDVVILWGSKDDMRNCKTDYLFTLQEQPLVIDFNGDMLPDILGEKDGEIYVWISSRDKMFTNRTLKTNQKLKQYHSSGLIDLNNDMSPDMLIMGEWHIETWYNTGKEFIKNDSTAIPYPLANWKSPKQSTFIDMNLNGKLDHIMAVCNEHTCHSSAVLIWNDIQRIWEVLLRNFTNPIDHTAWGFKLNMGSVLQVEALPPTLRAGDFDMDGYPDFITVLQSKKVFTDSRAVIMRNIPCKTCYSGRTIEILWDVPGLKDLQNIQIAAFFDIFEDGTLDILASSNKNQEWKIHALRNTEVFDSCFLKVLVLGGLCHPNKTTEPYGVNQPGPMVRYNMTTQDGRPLVSTSIQLSQSAHFPLQLPYSLFGLGQTPNFIDVLTVSVPATFNQTVHRREWIQIIPNSQIVVIPYPPDDEKRWVKKLFVTPSHLVLMTCISLVGTCIFLCLLVALLHWRERREDKKEKMQDACRFHFDAM